MHNSAIKARPNMNSTKSLMSYTIAAIIDEVHLSYKATYEKCNSAFVNLMSDQPF